MYYVYILKSEVSGRYYVGSTGDLESRIKKHNYGSTRSTKPFRPWVLVYKEEFESRTEACKRENQIKRFKSGKAFKRLVVE